MAPILNCFNAQEYDTPTQYYLVVKFWKSGEINLEEDLLVRLCDRCACKRARVRAMPVCVCVFLCEMPEGHSVHTWSVSALQTLHSGCIFGTAPCL